MDYSLFILNKFNWKFLIKKSELRFLSIHSMSEKTVVTTYIRKNWKYKNSQGF